MLNTASYVVTEDPRVVCDHALFTVKGTEKKSPNNQNWENKIN